MAGVETEVEVEVEVEKLAVHWFETEVSAVEA